MKLHIILLLSLGTPHIIHAMSPDAAEILAIAACKQDEQKKFLQQAHASLEKLPKSDETDHDDICKAFSRKDLKAIQRFIDQSEDLNTPIIYQNPHDPQEPLKITSLLDLASQHNMSSVVEELRLRGIDIDKVDDDGYTPLSRALTHGIDNSATVLFLITPNSMKATDKKGRGPLHTLLQQKVVYPKILELLIDQGAPLNAADEKGNTPIHSAASRDGSGRIIQIIFDKIAEDAQIDLLDQENSDGDTPLHLAIRRYLFDEDDRTNCIKLLLDSGASITVPNHNKITPMNLILSLAEENENDPRVLRARKLKEFLNDYFEDSIWEKFKKIF